MAVLSNRAQYRIRDGIGRPSSWRINIAARTAGNIAGTEAALDGLGADVQNLIDGELFAIPVTLPFGYTGSAAAASAQRGNKWEIVGRENTGNKRIFISTIPCAKISDLTLFLASQDYDPTSAVWISFTTDFNALAVTPEGNSISLQNARLVTRRK